MTETTDPEEHPDPKIELARRAVKWRTAAGWVMVLILSWRYLIYSIIDVNHAFLGISALPPLDPIAWEDVLAIIGLPVGGAFADRMTGDK